MNLGVFLKNLDSKFTTLYFPILEHSAPEHSSCALGLICRRFRWWCNRWLCFLKPLFTVWVYPASQRTIEGDYGAFQGCSKKAYKKLDQMIPILQELKWTVFTSPAKSSTFDSCRRSFKHLMYPPDLTLMGKSRTITVVMWDLDDISHFLQTGKVAKLLYILSFRHFDLGGNAAIPVLLLTRFVNHALFSTARRIDL